MSGAAFLPCDGRTDKWKCTGGASYQGPLHGEAVPCWLHELMTQGWYIGRRIAYCPRCAQARGLRMDLGRHADRHRFYELTGDELL